MSSGAGSSCLSPSAEYENKRKIHKKLKNKMVKKNKKHKREKNKKSYKDLKRSRKESTIFNKEITDVKKATSPKHEVIAGDDDKTDTFGPVLPPHLLSKDQSTGAPTPSVIGPIIPKELLETKEHMLENCKKLSTHESYIKSCNEIDDLQGSYGPLKMINESEMTAAQLELEQRALELKMAAIDGINTTSNINVREEWMLELPDVGLKSGLSALNNIKRGFYQGKHKPNYSDRSSWTRTPQTDGDKQRPTTSRNSKKEIEQQAQALYAKQRDVEQEALAKKHKKKHKREESLVQMHQKKLRKEEKKRAKKLKESGAKPERRPFARDIDLKLNKIDCNHTKQIIDKAKILNSKFSSGQSKYL